MVSKTNDFRNVFIVMILFSIKKIDHRRFVISLFSLLIVSDNQKNWFWNPYITLKTFFLILFSIRKIDHRGFVLVCLVCSLNLEFLRELWRGKTLDFRNLFIIMILKFLCYSDNLFLLILFSIRRIDYRRFVISLFSLQIVFENNFRELWSQKQLVFETFHHCIL